MKKKKIPLYANLSFAAFSTVCVHVEAVVVFYYCFSPCAVQVNTKTGLLRADYWSDLLSSCFNFTGSLSSVELQNPLCLFSSALCCTHLGLLTYNPVINVREIFFSMVLISLS